MSAQEQAAAAAKGLSRDDIRDLFQEFAKKSGGTDAAGNTLMAENAELRADKRGLKDKVAALEAKVPPEGSLVLTGDSVKLYNDLKALLKEGQKPEDLAKALKEHPDLVKKVGDLEKQQLSVSIAEAEGWKASVLMKLTQGMDLLVEEIEEEVDDEENEGKKKKVKAQHGFLNVKDASGAVTSKKRLSEELKEFIPSLVKDEGAGGAEGNEGANSASESGTRFVRQSRGDKGPPKKSNVSQDFINRRYAKPAEKK